MVPTLSMRSSLTSTTLFSIGSPPEPSMRVPPTNAIIGGCWAGAGACLMKTPRATTTATTNLLECIDLTPAVVRARPAKR